MELKGIVLDIASLHTSTYKDGMIVSLCDSGNELALSIQSKTIHVTSYDKKKDVTNTAGFTIKQLIDLIFKKDIQLIEKFKADAKPSIKKKVIKRKR